MYVFLAEEERANNGQGRADNDQEWAFFRAFKGTMQDFIRNSISARELLSRPDARTIYDPVFLDFMNSLIKG